jgi:trehalose 6-phosphate phosphatase
MPAFPPCSAPLAPPPKLARSNSILLDFDGTLVEIVDRPDAVVIEPALAALLQRLKGTFRGRVALVSGRSVAQLDGFLGPALNGIAVIGSHGGEIRAGDWRMAPMRPPPLAVAERELRMAFADRTGVVIEVKSLGVAVHYRLAPEIEPAARALVARIAMDSGLAVQEGKMMIELRAAGHDKGSGIAALMARQPFAGTVPVFVGDDVTDEAGFDAVDRLGGVGVLVGPERPTAARYRVADVAAVRAWLEAAA